MREFIHGWRRKVGSVALVMACMVLAAWFRSAISVNFVFLPVAERSVSVIGSARSSLIWGKYYARDSSALPSACWEGATAAQRAAFLKLVDGSRSHEYAFSMLTNLSHNVLKPSAPKELTVRVWIVPYWSLVATLTLLSACLILWKPRRSSKSDTGSVAIA